jgi:hypothetical protein
VVLDDDVEEMAQVIEDIWEQEGWPEEKENKSDENSV